MKLYKYLLSAVLAALVLLPGCKKDEKDTIKYMSGRLSLTFPAYVEPGFTKTFCIDTLMTVSRPDGGTVGYYFKDPDTGERDTLVAVDGTVLHKYYTVTVPDKLMSLSLGLYTFTPEEDNYYDPSVSVLFTIVRPGLSGDGSITNFEAGSSPRFTDARDGKEYYTVEAGGRTWMRQNLAWEGAGVPYGECDAMTDVFGRYYTWEEAQTACPAGWRLPADSDWTALESGSEAGKDIPGLAGKLMGDTYFNEIKMWEYCRGVTVSDALGFTVMPLGYASIDEDGSANFNGLFSYAVFWTSESSGDLGVCRYIYQDQDIVFRGRMSRTEFAASVRCVKE